MGVLLAVGSYALRAPAPSSALGALRFEEGAAKAGLDHLHRMCLLSDQFANIMPWLTSVGAAVAVADVDGDGRMDVYLTTSGRGESNRLLRSRGDGTFEDITKRSGTGVGNAEGASMAAVFGDIDNDGDQDLYVVMWGARNRLFENLGEGRFRDITDEAGVGYWGYGNGATFLDYDRDGRADLLVLNYFPASLPDPQTGVVRRIDLWDPFTTKVMHESFTHATNGGRNVLYRNLGGGRFQDVTEEVGLTYTGWTLAAGAGDLDLDGWPDLYLADDFGADEVYFNTGASGGPPRFQPFIGREGHPAIGDDWWKGMNVDLGDVDGDGAPDIYVTNILAPRYKTDEGNMLWLNLADPSSPRGRRFVNVGRKTGTHDGGWGWGAKFADFDNDGLLDIIEANGFVTGADPGHTYWYALQEMVTQLKNITSDAADWPTMGDRDLSGHELNRLWLQRPSRGGNLVFEEVAERAGITDRLNGRGVAVLDADDDGDLDILIANQGTKACFYKNLLYEPGHRAPARWLGLALVGDPDASAASAEERDSGADGASEVRSPGTAGDSQAAQGEAARGEAGDAAGLGDARQDNAGQGASGDAVGQGASGLGDARKDAAGRGEPGGAAARHLASTRDALGARAVLRAGGRTQTRVVSSAMGFAAQSDPRLFFGLSDHREPESLEIYWPSGRVQRFNKGELHAFVDRMTRIVEGRTPEAAP